MHNMRTLPGVTGMLLIGLAMLATATNNNTFADDKADKKQADAVKAAWTITEPVAKYADKKIAMKAEISKDNGTVTIANRAMLLSKAEYKAGCTVKFTWQWSEGHPTYPDHLAIVFRSGAQDDAWPYEIKSGLMVKLNPAGKGIVAISEIKPGEDAKELARNKDEIDLQKGSNHEIEIADTGEKISVSVGGKVVVETKVEKGGGKVSLYNREPVANVRHVSDLYGLTIEPLPAKKK